MNSVPLIVIEICTQPNTLTLLRKTNLLPGSTLNRIGHVSDNHSTFNVSKSHTFTNAGSTEVHDIGPYKRLQTGRDTIEVTKLRVQRENFFAK